MTSAAPTANTLSIAVNRTRHALATATGWGMGPADTGLALTVARELHAPTPRAPEVASAARTERPADKTAKAARAARRRAARGHARTARG